MVQRSVRKLLQEKRKQMCVCAHVTRVVTFKTTKKECNKTAILCNTVYC